MNNNADLKRGVAALVLAIALAIAGFWLMPYFPSSNHSQHVPSSQHTMSTPLFPIKRSDKYARDFNKGLVEGAVLGLLLNSK